MLFLVQTVQHSDSRLAHHNNPWKPYFGLEKLQVITVNHKGTKIKPNQL